MQQAFFIANEMNLQYFHIWSSADKPMFDFLVKVMCSVWIWAPGLRLPTHTAQIHKSLSWFTAGPKAVSVSSIWVRKKLRWQTHKADNDYFLRLSNQSKGPLDLDCGAPTWMDFDIYTRKARPLLRSQGTTLWYRSFDILDQIQSLVRAHSPLENIQIYPLSQNLGAGIQITCDITLWRHWAEQQHGGRHGQEEGEDERRHQDVTVSLL